MKQKFKIIVQDLETGEVMVNAETDAVLLFHHEELEGQRSIHISELFECSTEAALNVLETARQVARIRAKKIIKEQGGKIPNE